MGAAIEVTDLAKAYGELQAVDGVTFHVGEGEFFGILGPNGAGKTTILEMVEGLRRPDAGTIILLGVPAGVVLHRILVRAMGVGAGVELPQVVLSVFGPWELAVFALGGLVLATAGALLPAGWAARTRTATALRTE